MRGIARSFLVLVGAFGLTGSTQVRNVPPVAVFTYSPSNPRVNEWIYFDGRGSRDEDGTIVSWAWSFGDGTTGNGYEIQKRYRTAGTFTVALTVTDNLGATGTTSRTVTVEGGTQPDLVIDSVTYTPADPSVGGTVTFQVTVRNQGTAPAGAFTLQLQGTGVTQDVSVTSLGVGATVTRTFTLPLSKSPETFTAKADALDQVAESDETNNTRQVTVAPRALALTIATDKSTYIVGEAVLVTINLSRPSYLYLVELDASGRAVLIFPNWRDTNPQVPAGTTIFPRSTTYAFIASEPVGSDQIVAFAADRAVPLFPTSYPTGFPILATNGSVFLSQVRSWLSSNVAGESRAEANTTLAIRSAYANQYPTALFTWEALSPEGTRLLVQPRPGDRIRFDASGSKDPDGRITKYEWDWTSDGIYDFSTTDPVTEYRFPTLGSHKVTLRVTDDKGATATTSQVVTIGERKPPVADFTFSPPSPSILDTVQFTDRSTDPDGQVVSWKWEFGDGATSTEQNPSHRYSQKKAFTVRLTVTDNDGQSGSTTKTVTVVNVPPEAFFTFSPKEPYAGAEVTFDASSSQDKDGAIRSYAWDFTGDGVPDKEGPKVTWTFSVPGTYPVSLTVTDDDGAKATSKDTLVVTLFPQPVEARRVWAVVVGVGEYKDPQIRDLLARADAEAFYRFLVETAKVPPGQIQLFLDSAATLMEVRTALEWLIRRADEDDLVIFYFAGHGYQGTDLAPVDEGDGLDEYLMLYDTRSDSFVGTGLRDDEFGAFLDQVRAKVVLVVFDSCFAGGSARGDRGLPPGARPSTDKVDLWGDLKLEGKIVLAAGKENQSSYEHSELGQGVFTYFLLEGLRGKADANGDGRVTIEEAYGYVSREVAAYVRDKYPGRVQEPQLLGRGTPQVVLAKANQPPKAGFSFLPELPFPGKTVEFRDASTDDGVISAWGWDFGDGATSAERNPTHAYSESGTYKVTLTVTDDGGVTATVTKPVTVGPYGEVTAVDVGRGLVTISLGSRQGVKVGDRFEVVQFHEVPGGVVLSEVRAVIEVIQVLSADRAVCKVLDLRFPVQVKDKVRLTYPAP